MAYSTIYQGNGGAIDIWTEYTQDVANNRSTLTVIAYVKKTNSSYYSYRNSPVTFTLNINGVNSTYGWTFNLGNMNLNQRYEIMRASNTFYHAANGSVSNIGVSVYCATGTDGLGTISGSTTVPIATIPRASVPTLSPSSQNIGSAITINMNSAAGEFRHNITYSFMGLSGTISNQVVDSTVWTLPSSFAAKLSNTSSGTGIITVATYSGGTHVGSNSVSFTAKVPGGSAYDPIVSVPSISVSGGGRDYQIGLYVQNISKVYMSFSSTATEGASIVSNSINVKRVSDGGNSMTYSGTSATSGLLTLSGRYIITATATDSRGRSASATREFTVESYAAPTITDFTAQRISGAATYVNTVRSGYYTYLRGYNPLSVQVQRRIRGSSYTTLSTTAGTASGTFGGNYQSGGNSETTSYDFRLLVTDSFGKQASSEVSLSTSTVALSIGRDIGIGVGKVWESGALDVQGVSNFNGDTRVNGYPVLTTNSAVNATYFGWNSVSAFEKSVVYGSNSNGSWIKFDNGVLICWTRVISTMAISTAWGSLFYSPTQSWTFPHSFASGTIPAVTTSLSNSSGDGWPVVVNISIYSATMYALRATSVGSGTYVFNPIAIGRWK